MKLRQLLLGSLPLLACEAMAVDGQPLPGRPVPYVLNNGTSPAARDEAPDAREIELRIPVDKLGSRFIMSYRLRIFNAPQILPPDAVLAFEQRYPEDSVSFCGAVDLESSPRVHLMLRGGKIHPTNSNERVAKGKWNLRKVDLSSLAGKPFQNVFLSTEFSVVKAGVYKVSYRGVRIENPEGRIYWSLMPPPGEALDPADDGLPEGSVVGMKDQALVRIEPQSFAWKEGEKVSAACIARNADPDKSLKIRVQPSIAALDGEAKPLREIEAELKPGETRSLDVKIEEPLPPGHYRIAASVAIGNSAGQVESQIFTVSRKPFALPNPAEVSAGKELFWGADVNGFPGMRDLAELRQSGGNYANVFVNWSDLEAERGVYTFEELDRIVAEVGRANLRCGIFFFNGNPGDYPAWTQSEWMRDQNGKTFHRGVALSYWAPNARPAYMKLIKAIAERYKGNPTIIGYQLVFGGWGDGYYYGPKDGTLALYDYSELSQAKFREYLRDGQGLSLAELNARYKLDLKSWDELRQPEPQEGIDTRRIWWDFQNYRVWTIRKMWEEVCSTLRSVDKERILFLCYGGSQEATGVLGNDYDLAADIAKRFDAVVHNTCYEGYSAAPLLGSYSERLKITHSCELAGTPANYGNHQQGMFNILKFNPAGYCWVSGKSLDGIYGSFPVLRPVAQELQGSKMEGLKLGLLQSASFYQSSLHSTLVKHQKIAGAELSAKLGIAPDMFTDRAFLAPGTQIDGKSAPVLLDYGSPVLSAEASDALLEYNSKGGKLVLFPQSGRYAAGGLKEEFWLLSRLGYPEAAKLKAPGGREIAKGVAELEGVELSLADSTPLSPLPQNAKVLAKFESGAPALIQWSCGKGSATMIGGSPDLNDAKTVKALAALLAQLGLEAPVKASSGVETFLKSKGETLYAIVRNPSNAPVESALLLPAEAKGRSMVKLSDSSSQGLLSEARLKEGVKISLAPNEVAVYALDIPGKTFRAPPELDYPVLNGGSDSLPYGTLNAEAIAKAAAPKTSARKSKSGAFVPVAKSLEFAMDSGIDGAMKFELGMEPVNDAGLKVFLDAKPLSCVFEEKAGELAASCEIPDLAKGTHSIRIETQKPIKLQRARLFPKLLGIDAWTIAGPFKNPDGFKGKSFYAKRAPEDSLRSSQDGVSWIDARAIDGALRLDDFLPMDAKSVAYARCQIDAPRDCVARLDCGVDYAFYLWVNGEAFFDSNSIGHGPGPSEFGLDIPLKKGSNSLLFKVAPGSRGWSLHIKIGAMPGLKME